MNIIEAIKTAVETSNAQMAGRVADRLRGRGATYAEILAFVQKHTGIDPATWDGLMYEVDETEAKDPK